LPRIGASLQRRQEGNITDIEGRKNTISAVYVSRKDKTCNISSIEVAYRVTLYGTKGRSFDGKNQGGD